MVDTNISKRGRKLTACERCRKRKIKCDKHRPCTNCMKRNLPCHEDVEVDEQYESTILKKKINVYKNLEYYWKKQLEILMYIKENPIRSPLTNGIISPKIIHIVLALISLNQKLRNKIEENEAQTSICLDAFQSNMEIIFPGFKTSFNLQLATQFWTLLTETNYLSIFDEDEELNDIEHGLSYKISMNLDNDDIITILEYVIPFIRGCYVLGWKEIELKLFNQCRTMLKRIFFHNNNEKGLNRENSERLLHCLLLMGYYHEIYKRLGASSSCYILSHNIISRYGTKKYDPMVVTRVYCSLLWSSKTRRERDIWIEYSSSKVPYLHPFSYLVSTIGSELRLSNDDESLDICNDHVDHALHLLRTNESYNSPIFKDATNIYLKLAKAEIYAKKKQFKNSLIYIEKVHQKFESLDDESLPIVLKQIRSVLQTMSGLKYQYQREDGTWTTAYNELEKRLSHILTPPIPSLNNAVEWRKMNQKNA